MRTATHLRSGSKAMISEDDVLGFREGWLKEKSGLLNPQTSRKWQQQEH